MGTSREGIEYKKLWQTLVDMIFPSFNFPLLFWWVNQTKINNVSKYQVLVWFHFFKIFQRTHDTHFLYRFLDCKKTTRSQFCVPDLQEILWNLKQEKNFYSRESFFRKSLFCTFSWINPGFGGPWDKLWIFFLFPFS